MSCRSSDDSDSSADEKVCIADITVQNESSHLMHMQEKSSKKAKAGTEATSGGYGETGVSLAQAFFQKGSDSDSD